MEKHADSVAFERSLERPGFRDYDDEFVTAGHKRPGNALEASTGAIEIGRVVYRENLHLLWRSL